MTESASDEAPPAEHHLATIRTGRYFTAGADVAHAQHLWIVLHGYAQLASRSLRHFNGAIPANTLIAAPEGLSRFYLEMPRADGSHMARAGAAWLTREDREHEIDDANGWLDRVYHELRDRIVVARGVAPTLTVLAFSQGVATAMRWMARGVARPSRAIMWAGSVALDLDATALRHSLADTDVVLVTGTRDEFISARTRAYLREKWDSLGVATRELEYDGTHELNPPLLAELLKLNHP